jgi:hypothetical protein
MDLGINMDSITTLQQGIECIEKHYINKVAVYLKERKALGFTNVNITVSYS